MKKIIVMNTSGNAGKSTITREVLYPRFREPKEIIEVENVNQSTKDFSAGYNVEKYDPETQEFAEMYIKLLDEKNTIIDIGASLVLPFFREFTAFAGVDESIDAFVVPTTPSEKVQTDTAKTINFLVDFGIPAEKIKIIFNQYKKSVEGEFAPILRFLSEKGIMHSVDCAIPFSSAFKDIGLMRVTSAEIFREDVNAYKAQILQAKDPKEKLKLVKMDLANRQLHALMPVFYEVFRCVTGEEPQRNVKETPKQQTEKRTKKIQKEEVVQPQSDDDEDL